MPSNLAFKAPKLSPTALCAASLAFHPLVNADIPDVKLFKLLAASIVSLSSFALSIASVAKVKVHFVLSLIN